MNKMVGKKPKAISEWYDMNLPELKTQLQIF